jgi:endonuclease YncB( thermonuclease family)
MVDVPNPRGGVRHTIPGKGYFYVRAVFALLISLALTCNADPIQGRVIGVSDGDTITVLDATNTQQKVRLSGIDAPEKAQPFGNRSKESLSELVFGKNVTVDSEKRDRYGRNVGKVLVNGVDANLTQIQRGMAWHYKAYEREQPPSDRKVYSEAEVDAKTARLGLWSDPAPVPPWIFRRRI